MGRCVKPTKPPTHSHYTSDQLQRVHSACLTLATRLGSLSGHVVLVGGLVPSLLVSESASEAHVGTSDLDLGLSLTLLENSRYQVLVHQLRASGFEPDKNERGRATPHRWIDTRTRITVDFLIAPSSELEMGGEQHTIDAELSAFVVPGVSLAFRDQKLVELSGTTLDDEEATREFRVCGPGAFVRLKALAFKGRGENKDAYDLLYVLKEYGEFITDVENAIRPLLSHPAAREAISVLTNDFTRPNHTGPMRAAAFLGRSTDDAYKGDSAAMVVELLRRLGFIAA